MGFSRQEYWSGLPFPSSGNLPNPGIKPGSPTLQTDSLPSEPVSIHQLCTGKPAPPVSLCSPHARPCLCSSGGAWTTSLPSRSLAQGTGRREPCRSRSGCGRSEGGVLTEHPVLPLPAPVPAPVQAGTTFLKHRAHQDTSLGWRFKTTNSQMSLKITSRL